MRELGIEPLSSGRAPSALKQGVMAPVHPPNPQIGETFVKTFKMRRILKVLFKDGSLELGRFVWNSFMISKYFECKV